MKWLETLGGALIALLISCANEKDLSRPKIEAVSANTRSLGKARLGDLDVAYTNLLSRHKYGNYQRSVFSFEHGTGDDPGFGITHNDWDIEFGNGRDAFDVTMVTDDCSRILDLGEKKWEELHLVDLPSLPAYDKPTREPSVLAVVDHMYFVHTKDRDTDAYSLFKVESLRDNDSVMISWAFLGSLPELRAHN